MGKYPGLHIFLFCISFIIYSQGYAQVNPAETDTFFLAKKRGLLGRLGKSLSKTPDAEPPVKIAVPFLKYRGRIIRSVEIFPLDFSQNIDDTAIVKHNLAIRIANRLHKNTRISIIRNYLFFKEGDQFLPLLASDNESFLRNQPFLQDARIIVADEDNYRDSIDIVVITRDVFSIGGSINANTRQVRAELREENVGGSGTEISVSSILDKDRKPQTGIGAEIILRNIKGSFLNWTIGFNTFQQAFNSGRYEENSSYTRLEKPLVNRYSQWTGAVELAYNKTANAYLDPLVYDSGFQYKYSNIDLWAGYNIGYKAKKGKDTDKRLRHFVAARTFYRYFYEVPAQYDSIYNYDYANLNGVLFSYSLYKQNFYRTNYIYAFGRTEDVPTGLSASLIAGWTNKQNYHRPYYGIEFEGNRISKKGIFSSYKFRLGGSYRGKRFEDVNFLTSIDHFTRLRKIAEKWRNRNFISFSFTRQMNIFLDNPLFLRSDFGLPYFQNGITKSDERATLKLETDFYNLNKILGFRCAPFLFSDFCFLKPSNQPLSKTDGYSAVGGGLRVRNENLVFGTIELKVFYFPRTIDGMNPWKVDLLTKVRFKFNSNFIRKPNFIVAN